MTCSLNHINSLSLKGDYWINKMDKINVFCKSKTEIEADCRVWAQEIKKTYSPDLIVFIAKSGFLFAKPMAECLDCPMVDISISRPGNDRKDKIRKIIPQIPQWLLFALLRSKTNYEYQELNRDREVNLSERFKNLKWEKYKKVLIVDDSTDTGWSLIAAKNEIEKRTSDTNIKTASYCVIDLSRNKVNVEFSRYRNTIVVTATSRYSKEYDRFVNDFRLWKKTTKSF